MARIKNILLVMLLWQASLSLHAQQKYWIYLNEKSPHLKNATEDVIRKHMLSHGITPVIYSQWLHAISAMVPNNRLPLLQHHGCVLKIDPLNSRIRLLSLPEEDSVAYAGAIKQMHGDVLLKSGFTGKGVKVGVIDAGFWKADQNRFLKELIKDGQVKGYRNFIETDLTNPYGAPSRKNDYHGTQVLIHLAGSRENDSRVYGMAYDATFYLARTDQADKEYRGEEDYWVAALEWMHSQGVRLVNSSLGYSDGYDDPSQNYTPDQVDGKSAAIARVADIAVKEKGMILVLSAGNEGNLAFRVVSIPADAEGVLAVGATRLEWPWTKQGYSSEGPDNLSYVKPDVACYAQNGTSYSAPVITGLIASLWQARPDLTNHKVVEWIKESSHLSGSPNTYLGHGVPDARHLMRRINNQTPYKGITTTIRAETDSATLEIPQNDVVVYHKLNSRVVSSEEIIPYQSGTLQIFRPDITIQQSTIALPGQLIEIIWP
jgi:subtilisin family serine protease